jgi:hypothetical protein
MNPVEVYWAAVNSGTCDIDTLDRLNEERCDYELREMRKRSDSLHLKAAVIEVHCGIPVVEDTDV